MKLKPGRAATPGTLRKSRPGGIEVARRWYIEALIPGDDSRGAVTNPSLRDVADRAGVAFPTLEKRATKECWVDARQEFLEKRAKRESDEAIRALSREHGKARSRFFATGILLQSHIERRARQTEMSMREIASASTALGNLQEVVDTAVVGPKVLTKFIAPPPIIVAATGWGALIAPPPPLLIEQLAALDAEVLS